MGFAFYAAYGYRSAVTFIAVVVVLSGPTDLFPDPSRIRWFSRDEGECPKTVSEKSRKKLTDCPNTIS